MNKKDYRNLAIILGLILLYIVVNFISGNSYISQVDYISQHFRIPEYFRTMFYNNHVLFPTFAFNLGAGQNIFYLAYHGLFSPITYLSYLFPFIKMQDYMVIINIILLFLAISFFYYWLKQKFDTKITSIATFIFAFAGPLIYHTHRHIMFNNYMFFLVLALIFTDLYFEKKKKSPLIFAIFLIIMTSFYYSVVAIITICIYALYKYLNINKESNIKLLVKEALKFISIIIVPIFMSAILLIPTIYCIKNGREDTLSQINLLSTLIPGFKINTFFYQSYSVGLSVILIYSIISLFISKNKNKIVLAIISTIFLIFPFVCYALNGFMYLDGKCFIPLLPLFVYVIAMFLNDINKKNYDYKKLFIISSLVIFLIIVTNLNYKYMLTFIIDGLCIFIGLILYKYKNKFYFVEIPIIAFYIIVSLSINLNDNLVKRNDLNNINLINENLDIDYNKNYRVANTVSLLENVNNVLEASYNTTSIYSSLENKYYTNFVRNVFMNDIFNKDYHTITNTNNLLFNMYMANQYLISDNNIIGYNKVDNNLYKNDDVFSIGYSNNKLMSKEEFDTLTYPYSIDALMNYTIVNEKLPFIYNNKNINIYHSNYRIINNNISYIKKDNKYVFDVSDKGNIKLKLDEEVKNKILIITMDMNYNEKFDTSIEINNIKNTLSFKNWKYHNNNYTFHYVVSNTNELDINISKGHYEISNINVYVLDYNNYKNIKNNHDIFNITDINNKLKGNINVNNDGYFSLSIPYDKGFKIKLDNNLIDYELVNTSFIGFKLNKGYHEIEITYEPPYSKISSLISLIGVIIFIVFIWRDVNEKN